MRIYCPKCNTCYSLDDNLIPANGKKLRCQHCGEIWIYKSEGDSSDNGSTPTNLSEEDVEELALSEEKSDTTSTEQNTTAEAEIVPEEIPENLPQETPQTIAVNEDGQTTTTPAAEPEEKPVSDEEINKIFSRLKDETDKISEEKDNQPKNKKIFSMIKKILGWNSRLIITLEIIAILLILSLGAFALRFEIVRKFPQFEPIFGHLGVESKVIGEGLDFQNVTRNYIVENEQERLNIKGFIINTTDSELEIPTIVVNFLNNDAVLLAQAQENLEKKTIQAGEKVPFNLYTEKPSDDAKFVVLTFK